jgi:coenzyme F420-reducing hydrogenase alpha subunit
MSDSDDRTYRVELMSRVEGEGSFTLRTRGDEVIGAELSIFEAPRFFEAFLRGRKPDDVVDIVARICGICPIAYQVSASRAFERAFGVELTEPLQKLRRLLYCGEWIESHVLHVFMLHAPDFLGYPSAIEMAADHRGVVERGLRLKKTGNALIELLGGRATHPVSPCVGGFHKAPRKRDLHRLRDDIEKGLEDSLETVRWTAGLDAPDYVQSYVYVAMRDEGRYPIEAGESIAVSGRDDVPLDDWPDAFEEHHVQRSNALQARLKDGTPYLCGPMARLHHFADDLHPVAADVMKEVGLGRSENNPYRSIVVRAVETVHAFAEALDIVDRYVEPEVPRVGVAPPPHAQPRVRGAARVSWGCGGSEAPRGMLWHRYEIDAEGLVADARIIPPTSQNQARIEEDLKGLGPKLLQMDHVAATHLCEQLIRSYDPCISCATHFLDLRIEEEGS